jgi:hypothetical protein
MRTGHTLATDLPRFAAATVCLGVLLPVLCVAPSVVLQVLVIQPARQAVASSCVQCGNDVWVGIPAQRNLWQLSHLLLI